jgi:hypothetical protein
MRKFSVDLVEAILASRGLSWYRASKMIGVHPSAFSPGYLRLHTPEANRVAAMADALGCSMDDFFEEQPASAHAQVRKASATSQKAPSTAKTRTTQRPKKRRPS